MNKIQYNEKELRELIRFEMDPSIFSEENMGSGYLDNIEITGTYKADYKDIITACENIKKSGADYDTVHNWYYYIFDEIAAHYGYSWEDCTDYRYLWPSTDEELFLAMDNAFNDIFIYEDDSTDALMEKIDEIIEIKENYEYNKQHPIDEWKLSKLQKSMIMESYRDTDKVPRSKVALFRKIVDEMCEKDDPLALYIKGYGCYGGDKIYECDWEESRKCITKLFEMEGNPYYANTLGYIYYYGRCNGGVPEYEKAFQYFSIGAAFDVTESIYKQADMFLGGKGCIKSPQTFDHIINKLYAEARPRFCLGEDAKFADIALRKASSMERAEDYENAFYYYLEADCAIKKRLKKSTFFGNKTVQEKITKSIEAIKPKLREDFFKDEIVTDIPFWLFNMVADKCKSRIEIANISQNRYMIKISREKADHPGKALIVAEELERAKLARVFETEFETEMPVEYKVKDTTEIYIDNIRYGEHDDGDNLDAVEFCKGDEVRVVVRNAKFILKKTDFDKK
ncbi:MAG: hypothetical protein IK014_11700 [Lachnospiraceae bacterium]|nr:hypothetical protein [Lachnospiraceae bacterium]